MRSIDINLRTCPLMAESVGRQIRCLLRAAILLAPLLSVLAVQAQAGPLPDVVGPPNGINLCNTGFFSGFDRTTKGQTLLQYGGFEDLTALPATSATPVHCSS